MLLRQRGFSLLELLVALFVVVLVTSLATLNVGSGGQDLQLESQLRSLADINTLAADEAQMSGRDYGLLLQQLNLRGERVYRYSWRERREEAWRQPSSGHEVFAERDLPPTVDLELSLEGQLDSEFHLGEDVGQAKPQVIFYASGEVSPGVLTVRQRSDAAVLWRLKWDLLGRSELLPRGEALDPSESSASAQFRRGQRDG
ncbi:type II secretion system minor pseudopilin GspH [Parahaliea sp. F7430]|uniref:Type II secretion system protein H n=1 Tax=Sediminihaliea albiluteola TaxID=2758564 RepID=A0A7W2YIV7_9GAMM|nr:type II secretion system minor pseudopilin GspH [Sediminihaliea albiluteola]MBA6412911.1 type II secretion system minor pseudopilin GspH [Sediminihaliea albiluteola]